MCNWLGVAPFRAVEEGMTVLFVPGLCARVTSTLGVGKGVLFGLFGGRK